MAVKQMINCDISPIKATELFQWTIMARPIQSGWPEIQLMFKPWTTHTSKVKHFTMVNGAIHTQLLMADNYNIRVSGGQWQHIHTQLCETGKTHAE
jgi:hypothetical protein